MWHVALHTHASSHFCHRCQDLVRLPVHACGGHAVEDTARPDGVGWRRHWSPPAPRDSSRPARAPPRTRSCAASRSSVSLSSSSWLPPVVSGDEGPHPVLQNGERLGPAHVELTHQQGAQHEPLAVGAEGIVEEFEMSVGNGRRPRRRVLGHLTHEGTSLENYRFSIFICLL